MLAYTEWGVGLMQLNPTRAHSTYSSSLFIAQHICTASLHSTIQDCRVQTAVSTL